MIATYPLSKNLLGISGKPRVFRQTCSKAKKTAVIATQSDQQQQTPTAPPECEDGDYHLGRLIYTL